MDCSECLLWLKIHLVRRLRKFIIIIGKKKIFDGQFIFFNTTLPTITIAVLVQYKNIFGHNKTLIITYSMLIFVNRKVSFFSSRYKTADCQSENFYLTIETHQCWKLISSADEYSMEYCTSLFVSIYLHLLTVLYMPVRVLYVDNI
jgi:hypothetical protein